MKQLLIIALLFGLNCSAQTKQDSLLGYIFTEIDTKYPVFMMNNGVGDSIYALVDINTKIFFDLNDLQTFIYRKKHYASNL
jgi:hypothetical protein